MQDKGFFIELKEELKEKLKAVFLPEYYSSKLKYIKKMMGLFIKSSIILCILLGILYFISAGKKHKNDVQEKIAEHQKMVKDGTAKLNKEIDDKVSDLNTKMQPMLDYKDDLVMSNDLIFEYGHVDRERRANKADQSEDEQDDRVIADLMRRSKENDWDYKTKSSERSEIWDILEYSHFVSGAEDKLFRARSSLIAKKNLAKRYKEDIKRLESLNTIDNWDQITLDKKRAFVKKVDAIDENISDAELLKDRIEKDVVLKRNKMRAHKLIPILIQYDGYFCAEIYYKELRRAAELYGVDMDWTVPDMVKKELDWFNNREPLYVDSPREKFKKSHKEKCAFVEQMDKEYKALGDHPGFKTPLFQIYRNNISEIGGAVKHCFGSGYYPLNQKLKDLWVAKEKEWTINCDEVKTTFNGVGDEIDQCYAKRKAFYERKSKVIPKLIDKEIARSKEELAIKW
jgi:hypothetical protein